MNLAPLFSETFPEIQTPRLLLRGITPEDAPALFATFSDEDAMRYYGEPLHRSLKDSQAHIAHIAHWYAEHAGIRWGITLREGSGSGELIGSCGLFHFDEENQRAEVGYELRHAFWRRGIMSEALSALLDLAFGPVDAHRIEANVNAGNEASMGLLRSLGFREEGVLRERFWFADHFWDEHFFGLLQGNWRSSNLRA